MQLELNQQSSQQPALRSGSESQSSESREFSTVEIHTQGSEWPVRREIEDETELLPKHKAKQAAGRANRRSPSFSYSESQRFSTETNVRQG
jgi:hypothetical protein